VALVGGVAERPGTQWKGWILTMITIITDSSSYFRKNEALDLGIKVVPINYTIDGHSYSESFCDQNGDFENLLKGNGVFTTSHPNISVFLSAFEEELHNGNEVLCITISSRLSGAYGTAHMAAKQTESEKIAVFDSRLTAGGLYLLVKEAQKLITNGASLDKILKELPSIRDKITITFSVSDMTPLRNSGRMGFVRMSVSTFLNIKPILLCKDGAIVSDSVVHGNTELIKKLADKVNTNTKEVIINYIGDNQIATNLYHVIKKTTTDIPIALQKIGPALGIHLGLKAIAVSIIEK